MTLPSTLIDSRSASNATSSHDLESMMVRYLGPAIVAAFDDDDVTEIYTNPQDTLVRLTTRSRGRICADLQVSANRVTMFLDSVASSIGTILTAAHPLLEAELPDGRFRKARVQGVVPPLSRGPTLILRKPPRIVYSLDLYVETGMLSPALRAVLRSAVHCRLNIVVAGGTDTGKTTFANAVLHEIAHCTPQDRIVILEDTIELQCTSPDHLALRTRPDVSLSTLVKTTLRTSPDRIVVGEVRDASALDLLDAWSTGHAGGIATLHANHARGALHRLDRLVQRNNVPSQRELVADAVDLVVMLDKRNGARRVVDIARVFGLDAHREFHLESLTETTDPSLPTS